MRSPSFTLPVLILLLLAAFTSPSGAQRQQRRQGAAFNPVGTFSAQNSPESPTPRIDGDMIENIDLRKTGTSYGGSLMVLRGDKTVIYKFTGATAEPGKFSFTTKPVRGVSYRFEGKFNRGGDFARDAVRRGDDRVENILKGTMTKLSGESKRGEAMLKFDFLLGG